MSNKSLSKGGIYYLIYNVLNVAFPFLTGIYVSHMLPPRSIGTVGVAQNLAQYFVILAFLGIPTYGLREISRSRDNYEERCKVFSELFIINLCSTGVFSVIYLTIIISVPAYREELPLYLIVGLLIVLNAFNISWLYEGLEEYRFTALRNIIFKALSFAFLVVFVRSESDILWYALVTVVGTAGNYIINMIHLPRFVRFTRKELNLHRHLKSIFFLVTVNLAIELYSLVDTTMMNFMCEKYSIAFYKYGRGIEGILLQIVNTFTMVLVPRISFYYKNNRIREFNQLLTKGLKLVLLTSFPMIIGVFFTSDFLMVHLYGQPYIRSAEVLKILSFLLVISPVGYLLGSKVMLVTGHENLMIIPVGIGAIVNILGNSLLIPRYSEFGAAIASVCSEVVVMLIYICMGKKYFLLIDVKSSFKKIIISCVVMGLYLYAMGRLPLNGWFVVIMQVMGAILIYLSILVVLKEKVADEYFRLFLSKIKKKRALIRKAF